MRVFSSGNDAMINIVHASTEAAMKTLTVQTTKENLQAALLSQYSEASAFNIESYETKTVGSVNVYRYVVRYNADARMWAYAVTYGIVAPDQAYVITGTITDNNSTLLKAVEDSVYSFSVLKDEELKAVTDVMTGESETTKTDTKQTTAQTASPTASGETSTLSKYAQQTTMYSADSDVVNIRSGPGTDTDIVGTLAAGGKVTVTGETSGWYQVSVNGVTGYIRKDFLTNTQTTFHDRCGGSRFWFGFSCGDCHRFQLCQRLNIVYHGRRECPGQPGDRLQRAGDTRGGERREGHR